MHNLNNKEISVLFAYTYNEVCVLNMKLEIMETIEEIKN
jgi:hypothetical protein